jgi:hypothetical protein
MRIGNWRIRNRELGIGGWKLSQISTRYVTDGCGKYLPFLRQGFVTNRWFFVTRKHKYCHKYLLNL